MNIINIHTHLVIATPEGFPNKPLKKLSDTSAGFFILSNMLHVANPFTSTDSLDKLLTFISANKDQSMESMFNRLRNDGGYSERTMFVILTVNLSHMGAGIVKKTFGEVCRDLENLRQKFPANVLPFLHYDCRSGSAKALFDYYVVGNEREKESGKWFGVKMYNSLGTFPQDERHDYIYKKLIELNKPVIAHCTYSNPIHFRGKEKELKVLLGDRYSKDASRKENCNKFTDPLNWEIVAKKYPELRINLAHAGGHDAWVAWSKNPHDKSNLLNIILGVMQRNPNIYIDISFTLNDLKLLPVLYKLMTRDEYAFVRDRILFGSDWYMNKTECTERQWADDLEFQIGKEIFDKIARINTRKFLGL